MRCPACNSDDNSVIDSRMTEGGLAIRRRRQCQSCARRFTTKERVEKELRLTVTKTSGARIPYDREKIINGVERACYKIEITEDQIQQLVDSVEEELFRNHDREVTTERIGQYVIGRLRRLNAVAYVRFMSVYQKFNSVEEFVDEITDVKDRQARDSTDQQPLFEE